MLVLFHEPLVRVSIHTLSFREHFLEAAGRYTETTPSVQGQGFGASYARSLLSCRCDRAVIFYIVRQLEMTPVDARAFSVGDSVTTDGRACAQMICPGDLVI